MRSKNNFQIESVLIYLNLKELFILLRTFTTFQMYCIFKEHNSLQFITNPAVDYHILSKCCWFSIKSHRICGIS